MEELILCVEDRGHAAISKKTYLARFSNSKVSVPKCVLLTLFRKEENLKNSSCPGNITVGRRGSIKGIKVHVENKRKSLKRPVSNKLQ